MDSKQKLMRKERDQKNQVITHVCVCVLFVCKINRILKRISEVKLYITIPKIAKKI